MGRCCRPLYTIDLKFEEPRDLLPAVVNHEEPRRRAALGQAAGGFIDSLGGQDRAEQVEEELISPVNRTGRHTSGAALDAVGGDVGVEGVPGAPAEPVEERRQLLPLPVVERLQVLLHRPDGGACSYSPSGARDSLDTARESNSQPHPLPHPRHSPLCPRPPPPMAPMATISAPLAARAAPSGLRPHRRNGARARLGLRGVKFVSHGVSSQQDERKRCHSSLRKNTIVASENENPPLMPAIMTPGGPFDLETVLLGNRVIFIGQYINSQVAQRVISQLVTLATVDEEGDILIYLNCPGGSLYSILAIYDCMSWIKPKVGTVGFGVVASQAAIILSGGEKGMRYAMPNTRVMIHQPQGGSEGNVEEVRRQVGETIYARDKVDKMFAAFTGQPLDMVQQWTERDRFMSSSEAMDFGLVDALLETRY